MKPMIGIIGGSGLYSMPGFEAQEEHLVGTPFGEPSDVYVVGKLAGKEVAFLTRHGRGHRIPAPGHHSRSDADSESRNSRTLSCVRRMRSLWEPKIFDEKINT